MSSSPEIVMRVDDLRKQYGKVEILRGVSFDIAKGQTKVIAGP